MPDEPGRPPRDNLVRAMPAGLELRASEDGGMPTLDGHFAVFNQWAEINSLFEGRFMEQISPGAFRKTIRENKDSMRILFQHGRDPQIGDKPLAPIEQLNEDGEGAHYAGQMLDTTYNQDLRPGLEAGLYGSSFRFMVMKEEFDAKPKRSPHNPEALPERTVKEAQVFEFGPVTFPAYPGASVGLRSMTDEFILARIAAEPEKLQPLIANADPSAQAIARAWAQGFSDAEAAHGATDTTDTALSGDGAGAEPHSDEESRDTDVPTPPIQVRENPMPPEATDQGLTAEYRTVSEMNARLDEVKARLTAIGAENEGRVLPEAVQAEWDRLNDEVDELKLRVAADAGRRARLAELARDSSGPAGTPRAFDREPPAQINRMSRDAIYDIASIESRTGREPVALHRGLRDNALRAVEETSFPTTRDQDGARSHIRELLDTIDEEDVSMGKAPSELARRILVTGNPTYRRAIGKYVLMGGTHGLTPEEQRALSQTGASGGFAITFDLDPTIVPTSNSSVNPFRAACRTVTIAGTNEWRGVSSGAITAQYRAEAAVTTDNSPTLAQPAFIVQRADAFVPFSIEIGQDWGSLQSEMGQLFQDAKDDLEATQFATGVGTTVFPQGITIGATNTATTGTTTVLAVGDIYKTEEALPPRFRARAQWFANRFIYNKVRQLDTAGGANLWIDNLRLGLQSVTGSGANAGNVGASLIGYPVNESTAMAASLATTTKLAVLGDPQYYVIVDRIGMDIEVITNLTQQATAGTGFGMPTGQRGLFAYWRNTARVFNAAGFITLVGL